MTFFSDSSVAEQFGQLNAQVLPPTITANSLNGTLTLAVASTTSQIITGSATGYSTVLPNATTLRNGWTYRIYNLGLSGLTVKYNGGTTLVQISANSVVDCYLENNSTTDGIWIVLTGFTSGGASGTQEVDESTTTSTTSSGFVQTGLMTITPQAGSYFVMFSSDSEISNSSSTGYFVLEVGGVQIAASQRGNRGGFRSTNATQGLAVVNGTQAIRVLWKVTAGTFSSYYRSLTIVKYT